MQNMQTNTKWTKTKDLIVGAKIAAADLSSNQMFWDEIVSIEKVGRERVWDIEVDGTRNFVGNQLIAHNTYINGTASASGALTLFGTPTIASTALQTLTLGGTTTGNIQLSPGSATPSFVVTTGGQVGIGTTSPAGKLDVTDTSNTAASLSLTNNTATTIGSGVNTLGVLDLQSTTLTTGNFLNLEINALTSGKGLNLTSTSTGLTTGNLAGLDWSPGSATTATGDLLKLNIGANGLIGNIFNVLDNGSSVFSVSQTAITAGLPASFTAAGDVSLAYDLLFTNQTANYIKSNSPLYLDTGETWESNNLTLQTYNAGNIIANTQALAVNGAATISGNFLVADSQTATSSAFIANTNTAAGIVGLGIKLSSTTLDTTSRFINFLDKSGIVIGKINAANTTTVAYSANGTDMAEYFVKSDETFSPGDVVSASDTGLTKTSVPYNSKMIGIVSTAPSFVGGEDDINKVLVAIVGQVPVKIATSSPAIAKGDFVTSSLETGRATKAVKPGFVIGKALENWQPGGADQILVYVNNSWADPDNSFAVDVASISAQLANLQLQNNPAASLSADLWQYATESGKLATIFPVQVPELTVTGKLNVGLLSFDDLESSISSLTGAITIKGDLAVSGSLKVLGASAGKAVIPAGSLDISIGNSLASTTSAIFVTPEDPVAISGQSTQSGQFTIRIPQALSTDLKFQWWIVN